MLILGLLLLACTAAFTGLALSDNLNGGPDYTVTVLGHDIATMNSLAIFCAGLALALIFCLALAMMLTGGALRWRHHRKYTTVRRDALAAARERDERAARSGVERSAGGAGPGPETPTAGGRNQPAAAANPAAHPAARRDDLAANRGMAGRDGSADATDPGGAPDPADRPSAGRHRGRHARHLFGH